jgi:hypothetical protein
MEMIWVLSASEIRKKITLKTIAVLREILNQAKREEGEEEKHEQKREEKREVKHEIKQKENLENAEEENAANFMECNQVLVLPTVTLLPLVKVEIVKPNRVKSVIGKTVNVVLDD